MESVTITGEVMNHPKTHLAAILIAATIFILSAGNAVAEDDPLQILDRVTVTGSNFALDLKSNDPERDDDFSVQFEGSDFLIDDPDYEGPPPIPQIPDGTNLVDCTSSVTDGLFCIDRKKVVNWSNIDDASSRSTYFDCTNSALGLDKKKSNPCTALARNAAKTIYLGGKKNGKSNVVGSIRAATPGEITATSCSDGDYFTDNGNSLCYSELADGRPLVQDLDVIDGDLADVFAGEEVLLVLEERKSLLQYSKLDPSVATVTDVIASGKNDWGLIGNEQLLNATLLPNGGEFYALAATTKGRVLAVNADINSSDTGFPVFDFKINRNLANGDPAGQCAPDNETFDVTVSEKTGRVYVTDGEYCLVHVLQPTAPSGGTFMLQIVTESPPLTLSTNDPGMGGLGTFPPLLVNVTPGIVVDLSLCDPACTPVTASNGDPGLTMREVDLGDSVETEMILFQITGYPDCRWNPIACALLLDPAFTGDANDAVLFLRSFFDPLNPGELPNVIVDFDPNHASDGPALQLLNLEPLLPAEIKALFPNGLEPLLMEREVRAMAQNDYFFDAFFGISPDGLFFERSYELEIDAEELLSDSGTGLGVPATLGCVLGLPEGSPLYATLPSRGTLDWDVMTKVSEKFKTITSNSPPATSTGDRRPYAASGSDNYETRFINSGCTNPARGADGGWSMVSYGLEVTPCTAMRNEDDNGWILEGVCNVGDPAPPFDPPMSATDPDADEAVLAKLLLKEYKDFRDALNELACVPNVIDDPDGAGPLMALAPIDSGTCSTIDDVWVNGLLKLLKGLEATLDPKDSQGNENLGAFAAKLAQLQSMVENYIPPDPLHQPDLANRRGELEARLLTIEHIYLDRFQPSITDDGFMGDGGWIH
jgi:hypothetical protein